MEKGHGRIDSLLVFNTNFLPPKEREDLYCSTSRIAKFCTCTKHLNILKEVCSKALIYFTLIIIK